ESLSTLLPISLPVAREIFEVGGVRHPFISRIAKGSRSLQIEMLAVGNFPNKAHLIGGFDGARAHREIRIVESKGGRSVGWISPAHVRGECGRVETKAQVGYEQGIISYKDN